MRRVALASSAIGCAAAVLTGCGSSSGSPTIPTVTTASIGANGTVLVDGSGHALYMFVPDKRTSVTCVGACAGTWPPLFTTGSGTSAAKAGTGVQASLLGTDKSPSGGLVVTYDGWPLYTYAADLEGAQAAGQAVDLNGGYWYLMKPDGVPLVPAGSPPA